MATRHTEFINRELIDLNFSSEIKCLTNIILEYYKSYQWFSMLQLKGLDKYMLPFCGNSVERNFLQELTHQLQFST